MKKKLARMIALVLCAVLLLGMIPLFAAAEEIQPRSITQSWSQYYLFETFEDLKELAAGSYDVLTYFDHTGEGELVISEDLVLPENTCLCEADVRVAENVTFGADTLDCTTVVVEGKADIQSANIWTSLQVSGELHAAEGISLENGAQLEGLEHITMEPGAYVQKSVEVESLEGLKAVIAEAEALEDSRLGYTVRAWCSLEIAETLEIPESCKLYCSLRVAEGGVLNAKGGLSTSEGIEVYGKLMTPELTVNKTVGAELHVMDGGSIDIPRIYVYDYDYPDRGDLSDVIYGVDLSEYEILNHGDGSWVLTYKGAADDPVSGDNLTWNLDDKGVLTISGSGPMSDFTMDVAPWNLYGGQLTHVVIEPGVTSIGAHAFEMCSMTSIDIPDTVTSIGKQAFHLSGLESAVIPESVTRFGDGIFGHSNLAEITLPDNMTEIPNEMFYGCSQLTSIEIPAGVKTIGDYAFFNTSMDRVTVPAGVVSVGDHAFGNYTQFKYAEITFFGDGPAIADGAFAYQNVSVYYPKGNDTWNDVISGYVPDEGDSITWTAKSSGNNETPPSRPISGYCGYCETCSGRGECGDCGQNLTWTLSAGTLTISGEGQMGTWGSAVHQPWYGFRDFINAVEVESGVTTVGDYAFYGADNLLSVTIDEGVTEIGGHAMKYCKNLSHVSLPSTIEKIGGSTFFGSDKLTSAGPVGSGCAIEFAWTEHIPTGAFNSHTALTEVILPDTLKTIGDKAFLDCFGLTSIELPDGLVSIGKQAFEESSLTSIVIPGSVTEMGDEAFQYCPLTELKLSENLTVIPASAFEACDELTAVVIPEAVTEIGSDAFAGCIGLTQIRIPDNVTEIRTGAFGNCTGLTSVTLPDSLTSIGSTAFAGCIDLEEIVIPAAVTKLGASAFGGCTALTKITFRGSAPEFDFTVFRDVTATAYYPAGDDTWNDNKMRDYGGTIEWVAASSDTPGDNETERDETISGTCGYCEECFGQGMCGDCSDNLTWTLDGEGTLTISGIGEMQHDWNEGSTFSWYAYKDRIRSLVVEEGVTDIGSTAFYGYRNLTSVSFPSTLTRISGSAFTGTGIVSLELPVGVTYLGDIAFSGCEALEHVTLPSCSTGLGMAIFAGCTNLKSIDMTAVESVDGSYAMFEECHSLTNLDFYTADIIGSSMFQYSNGFTQLNIPEGVVEIRGQAFAQNANLTSVIMPTTLKKIGHTMFVGCDNLTEIRFTGDAPEFAENAFMDITVTAYYPADNATWTEAVLQNYDGSITWIAYEAVLPGDTDGSGGVDASDVAQLLWHTLFPDTYEIVGNADFNGDGKVNDSDVAYLLWHTLFPDTYPIG